MKNTLNNIATWFQLILLMVFPLALTSCSNAETTGFDNTEYDISTVGDNSVIADIRKIKSSYKLTLSGSGEVKNFSEITKVPWYSIARKIKEVDIKDGITHLGTAVFNKIDLAYFILPESVTSVTDTSFKRGTVIYSYSSKVDNASEYDIAFYSAGMPSSTTDKYWRLVSGTPLVWIISPVKALFVGNSFTYYNDIPGLTAAVAQSIGYNFTAESVTVGSHTLSQFANETDAYGAQVYAKLKKHDDYDYLILQEQSTRSYTDYLDFEKGAGTLKKLADSTQAHCQTILYSTWGYKEAADAKHWTIPEMEKAIRDKNDILAKKLGIKVNYVGKAFSEVYEAYPAIDLYYADEKHPSYAGSYLSALIHIESLFSCDIRLTTFRGDLDKDTFDVLKQAAYNSYFGN